MLTIDIALLILTQIKIIVFNEHKNGRHLTWISKMWIKIKAYVLFFLHPYVRFKLMNDTLIVLFSKTKF